MKLTVRGGATHWCTQYHSPIHIVPLTSARGAEWVVLIPSVADALEATQEVLAAPIRADGALVAALVDVAARMRVGNQLVTVGTHAVEATDSVDALAAGAQ